MKTSVYIINYLKIVKLGKRANSIIFLKNLLNNICIFTDLKSIDKNQVDSGVFNSYCYFVNTCIIHLQFKTADISQQERVEKLILQN